jgi:hypothetical protein
MVMAIPISTHHTPWVAILAIGILVLIGLVTILALRRDRVRRQATRSQWRDTPYPVNPEEDHGDY